MPKVNWNTLILTAGFTLLGFLSKELYREVRDTHDAVLVMKAQMVDHHQYDVEMADVKSRIQAIQVEIEEMKQKRP